MVEDDICVLFDISMIFKPSNIEKNGGKVTLSRINNIIIYCLEIDIPDRLTGGNGIIPGLDYIKRVAPIGRKAVDRCDRTGSVQGDCFECISACTFNGGLVFERAAGQLGTGFNHQLDIRVQGAQCVFLTGEIITAVCQRQRVIARIKIPAVAAVILGAAFGANGVAVFVDHQPGQLAQGNGVCFGGWCGKSDIKDIGLAGAFYLSGPFSQKHLLSIVDCNINRKWLKVTGIIIQDGDTSCIGRMGNNITRGLEIFDACLGSTVRGFHIQGITVSDLVALWFFLKNAAIYGTTIRKTRDTKDTTFNGSENAICKI